MINHNESSHSHCINSSNYVLLSPVDTCWITFQNLCRIKVKFIFVPSTPKKKLQSEALRWGPPSVFITPAVSVCYSRQLHHLIGLQHPQAVSFKLCLSESPPQTVPCDLICPLSVLFPSSYSFSSFTHESLLWFGLGIKRVQMDEYVSKQKWS